MLTQLIGDCRETMKTLDAGSVQCVITSPPYFGLRNYSTAVWRDVPPGTPEHEHAPRTMPHSQTTICTICGAQRIDQQIGLEQTPAEYVAALVAVFGEVWRVLRDDGTVWLNLGDSYAGSGKGGNPEGSKYAGFWGNKDREKSAKATKGAPTYGLKPKDLIGIPWRVAFALQDAGWYLRSDIIWAKPNCMPESVTDRPTRSHEYLFLLTKRERYYYDADAIREPMDGEARIRREAARGMTAELGFKRDVSRNDQSGGLTHAQVGARMSLIEKGGRNRRTVWTVSTQPYSGSHFAVFPEALIEPCILAGSRVGDTVLDPFAGSGTTGRVAIKHGRHAILCELNPDYLPLQDDRTNGVQMTLQVE